MSKREHIRIDDVLPIYYERYREDAEEPEWDILFEQIEPTSKDEARLYELLFDMNQKVNLLVEHLAEKEGFRIPAAKQINISGGGMSFVTKEFFQEGERLLIKLFLPTYPRLLKLKCEVVRVMKKDDENYRIGLKYVDIDERTRDSLIKYIFARQREHLRRKKEDDKEKSNKPTD